MAAIHQLLNGFKKTLTPSQKRVLDGVADAIAPMLEQQEAVIYAERQQLVARLSTVDERHRPALEKTSAAHAAALANTAKLRAALDEALQREHMTGSASYAASVAADREANEIRADLIKSAPAIVIRANEEFLRFDLGELQPASWFAPPAPRLTRWDRERLEATGGIPLEHASVDYMAAYLAAIEVMQQVRADAQALLYAAQTEGEAFEAVEALFRRANAVIRPLKGRAFEIGENGQIKRGPGERGSNIAPTPEESTK